MYHGPRHPSLISPLWKCSPTRVCVWTRWAAAPPGLFLMGGGGGGNYIYKVDDGFLTNLRQVCNRKVRKILKFQRYPFKTKSAADTSHLHQVACRAQRVRWEAAPFFACGFRDERRHNGGGRHHQEPPRAAGAVRAGLGICNSHRGTMQPSGRLWVFRLSIFSSSMSTGPEADGNLWTDLQMKSTENSINEKRRFYKCRNPPKNTIKT